MAFNCKNIKIKQGNKGKQVTELQEALKTLGYLPKTFKATGEFKADTFKAVKKFQEATKNTPDGWVGPQTCKSLNSKLNALKSVKKTTDNTLDCPKIYLKEKSKDKEKVKILQTMLKEFGYYTRQVDGDYGPYTKEAVSAYQRNTSGLRVDGEFGPVTCKKFTEKYKEEQKKKATAKNTKTTTKKTVVLDPNRPDPKKNIIKEKDANLSIDGIFFIASSITPSTPFNYGNYSTLDMMDGTSYTYQTHPKQREYSVDIYLHKRDLAELRNEFEKMTKRVCKVLSNDIIVGNYVINVTYAWSNLSSHRKVTLKLTEWRG